MLYWN